MIRVHSFESMGTFDGPGLRLVVFLQGCNFRCLYCANPDTIDLRGESRETPLDELVAMAMSQRPFFGRRGGVTFSGGEPLLQARELIPLVRALRAQGIHVCVDTNGSIWNDDVRELLELVDLVLLDVKQFNPVAHRTLTSVGNERTLALASWLEANSRPFWMRYVLVQGYSSSVDDIRSLCENFSGYKMIERVEILPYHRLGVHKYEAMGLEYKLGDVSENTSEQLEAVSSIFGEYFSCVYVN
ncbi:MAG: pyruvate formate-lyase-activating protein [Rikenellaceae bacterium]